jgi:hypothetical protein
LERSGSLLPRRWSRKRCCSTHKRKTPEVLYDFQRRPLASIASGASAPPIATQPTCQQARAALCYHKQPEVEMASPHSASSPPLQVVRPGNLFLTKKAARSWPLINAPELDRHKRLRYCRHRRLVHGLERRGCNGIVHSILEEAELR